MKQDLFETAAIFLGLALLCILAFVCGR